MIEHFCHQIPHHCDFWSLYADAVNRIPVDTPAVFVEVGTWHGSSLAFLAVQAHNSGKDISLIGVDAFEDSPDVHMAENPANGEFPTLAQVQAHFTNLPRVRLIKGVSWEVAAQLEDESVDFAFIDCAHDYASVSKDIAAYWGKIKPGGYLAGHDYSLSYPGVVAAVHEKFGPVKRVVSSWIVQKLK